MTRVIRFEGPTTQPWTLCFAIVAAFIAAEPMEGQEQSFGTANRVHVARSDGGMVVCTAPLASRIGGEVLREGGTAVDAAVSVALAMAVVWPEAGNLGGGGFMLVHPVDGAPPTCIDYREMAPGKAHLRMYTAQSSRHDALAVGVPGTVRGLSAAHARYGKLPWRRLVEPAIALARDGFSVDPYLAASINGLLSQPGIEASRFDELRRVYGRPDGKPWQAGQRLVLPDLGKTLERIASGGAEAFYRGEIAELLVAEMELGGGWIDRRDLASYTARIREPVRGSYRGYDIFGAPPPSSGGICTILSLQMLEPHRLREHPRFSARNVHLITEAMRRSFLVRARSLGDPDYVRIPPELLTSDFAAQLGKDIDPERATTSEALAPDMEITEESESTTHFSVVDPTGMAVANTYTLEASWGSRIVVRGAGFVLNNEMGDFNWLPGITTRKGRIGTAPNQIAPHKRMLSSQAPTIVAKKGRPVLITGSPGGRTIINTVTNIILNVLEFQMSLPEAITVRRTHHQWLPDQLFLEGAEDPTVAETVRMLRGWGHDVRSRGRQGSAHSIWIDPETDQRVGVADWRRGGMAVGVPQTGVRRRAAAR